MKYERLLMALELVRSEIILNNFILTKHAWLRMTERNVTRLDIVECVRHGLAFVEEEKFHFVGYDSEGLKLKVICVYNDATLIITVF